MKWVSRSKNQSVNELLNNQLKTVPRHEYPSEFTRYRVYFYSRINSGQQGFEEFLAELA